MMTSTEEKATRTIQRTIKQSKRVLRPRLKGNKKGRRIKRNGPIRPFKELRALLESSIITEKDILDADSLNARTRSQRAQWQQSTFSSGGTSADSSHSSCASSPIVQQRENANDFPCVSISAFPFQAKSPSLLEDKLATTPSRKPATVGSCSPLAASHSVGESLSVKGTLGTVSRNRDYKSDSNSSSSSKVTETFQGHLRRSQRIAGIDRDYTFLKYKHSSGGSAFTSAEIGLNDFAKISTAAPLTNNNNNFPMNVENTVTLDHAYSKPPTPSNQAKPFNLSPIQFGFSRDSKSKHFRSHSNRYRMRNWRKMLNLGSEDDEEEDEEEEEDSDEDDSDEEDETDNYQDNKRIKIYRNYKCKRKRGNYTSGNKKLKESAREDFNVKTDASMNNAKKTLDGEELPLRTKIERKECLVGGNDIGSRTPSNHEDSPGKKSQEMFPDSSATSGKKNANPNYKCWKKKPVNLQKSLQGSTGAVRQRMRRGRGGGSKQISRALSCGLELLPNAKNFNLTTPANVENAPPMEVDFSSTYDDVSKECLMFMKPNDFIESFPCFNSPCSDLLATQPSLSANGNIQINSCSFICPSFPFMPNQFENQYRNGDGSDLFFNENSRVQNQPLELVRKKNKDFRSYGLTTNNLNVLNKYEEGNGGDSLYPLNRFNNFPQNKRRGRPLKYSSSSTSKEYKGVPQEASAPPAERRDKRSHSLSGHRSKKSLPPRPLTKWSLLSREQKTTSIKGWTYLIQLALEPSQIKEFWEAVEQDVVKMQVEYLRHKGQRRDWEMDENLMTELRNGLIWKHVCRCHDVITKQLRGKLRELTQEILEEQSACDRYLLAKQVDIAKNICALTEWCSTTSNNLDSQSDMNSASSRLTEILQTLEELEERQQHEEPGPAEMELLSLGGESVAVPVPSNPEICDRLLKDEQFTGLSLEAVEECLNSGSEVNPRSNLEFVIRGNWQTPCHAGEETSVEPPNDWVAGERT